MKRLIKYFKYNNRLTLMKSKITLITLIIRTVLMIGIMSSPMVAKIYAQNYNDYNSYGQDSYYNDHNRLKIIPPNGLLTADWWKWVIAIPPEINPLLDETGKIVILIKEDMSGI